VEKKGSLVSHLARTSGTSIDLHITTQLKISLAYDRHLSAVPREVSLPLTEGDRIVTVAAGATFNIAVSGAQA
jgi:hypothetical protein